MNRFLHWRIHTFLFSFPSRSHSLSSDTILPEDNNVIQYCNLMPQCNLKAYSSYFFSAGCYMYVGVEFWSIFSTIMHRYSMNTILSMIRNWLNRQLIKLFLITCYIFAHIFRLYYTTLCYQSIFWQKINPEIWAVESFFMLSAAFFPKFILF